jgi:hypothetical protein
MVNGPGTAVLEAAAVVGTPGTATTAGLPWRRPGLLRM